MSYATEHAQVTRRSFVKGIGLLGVSAAVAAYAGPAGAEERTDSPATMPLLAIIHTNDTHGHDVAVEATEDRKGNFSMAAVGALKTEWEQKGYEVLLVDAGDASQGMPLVDMSDGASAISFMNACGYDLMVPGNHEFDWGPEALAANEKAASFPIISANVLDKQTGEPRFATNKVFELRDGTLVGVFGLTTPMTAVKTSPKCVEGFEFLHDEDLFACAQAQVDELRAQGCELVMCVGHLGNLEESAENTSKSVIERVKGIDVFVDGHDHKEVAEQVGTTLLVETGCHMHNIGVVVIDEGAPSAEPVAAGTYDGIDPSAQAVIDQEDERVNTELAVTLGSTSFFMNGEREPGVRTQETNLGDFCADALRWVASYELGQEVDAGIINSGAIRASIEAGDISLKSIKTVMPYCNELVTLHVSGAQLFEAIEAACQAIGKEKPIGAFPQVSGISFTVDASVPYEEGPLYPGSGYHAPAAIGARVTIHDVGGRAFDPDAEYLIACPSFIGEGGDTYYVFKEAVGSESPVTFGFDYEAVVSYLVEACDHVVPDAYAEPQGRITITGLA